MAMAKSKKIAPISKNSDPAELSPQQKFEAVCELIETSNGSIPSKCKIIGVAPETFYKMLNSNEANAKRYARAKELQCSVMFESMVEISNEALPSTASGSLDGAAVQDKRVRIDTLKWALSKMMPKKYGDKIDMTTNGKDIVEKQIDINDLSPEAVQKISDALLAIRQPKN
jgi:hypothetical protein